MRPPPCSTDRSPCPTPAIPRFTVGDLHGDMSKTIKSLAIARVAEERDGEIVWTGGDTVVVQLGDVLDRGDTEIGAQHHIRCGRESSLMSGV